MPGAAAAFPPPRMNYFNYFTEIEEHFQKARGAALFLLSPLDWALIEAWKESGVPLEAALKGIDRTFEKWHARKHKIKQVNSLAYCAQEVLTAARESEGGAEARSAAPAFAPAELADYLRRNAAQLRQAARAAPPESARVCEETAQTLEQLAAQDHPDLEALEQRLTVLEERLRAAATQARSEEELLQHRREMDRQLAPYRRKMTADQLVMLEKQYLDRRLLEAAGLPRLSLFFL
ncbi:MAG TPA: hypothetical protein VEU62_05285 [Bryobacterales bacterium]|nr:hypothetical protein [Bryobacterales bacterium]